ncbi:MAG: matrixin family metalloprotease [Polyangiaceae bacterium]
MRASRVLPLASIVLGALATAPDAAAFCRTTTCQQDQCEASQECEFCLVGGRPLYWASKCISFGVQVAGSPLRGVDFETTRNIVGAAFVKWMSVDCGGGATPTLEMRDYGAIECARQEYNKTAGNANVWMYRDDYWPYSGPNATLALTTITFNVNTGEIFDADVEVNSVNNVITVGDNNVQADLDSIVTHEAGHFLGLSHSCDGTATMFRSYQLGDTSLRSLEADDVAGICTLFPPGSGTACNPEPRHGFASECCNPRDVCEGREAPPGCCTVAPGSTSNRGQWAMSLAVLAMAGGLLRRRRRRRLG